MITLPNGRSIFILPPQPVRCARCGRAALLLVNYLGRTVCALCAEVV